MKIVFISFTLLATAWAQTSLSEYLPPVEEYNGAASSAVETNFLENEPAHSLADDGYRYKAIKRFRLRHRRDVSELSNDYLPPPPAYSTEVSAQEYEVEASEPAPAHSLENDGYHYKAVKRYRLRRRRDVSELPNNYLPAQAASTAETVPAPVYAAPAPSEEYEVEASEPAPAHSLENDGYHYKTVKRYRLRRRRDVSELPNNYLPAQAASTTAETVPATVYAAPAPSEEYEVEASEPAPAHSLENDGYRYKTVKRYRLRRRRDVSEISNNYLPPHAASASVPVYSAPTEFASTQIFSAPAVSETYEIAASEPAPAHSFSVDGYSYKTVKHFRHRRLY